MVARVTLIDRIAQAVANRLASALDVEPGYDDVYDRAFDAALARGVERDEAHAEAMRVADAWQVAQRSEGAVKHEL